MKLALSCLFLICASLVVAEEYTALARSTWNNQDIDEIREAGAQATLQSLENRGIIDDADSYELDVVNSAARLRLFIWTYYRFNVTYLRDTGNDDDVDDNHSRLLGKSRHNSDNDNDNDNDNDDDCDDDNDNDNDNDHHHSDNNDNDNDNHTDNNDDDCDDNNDNDNDNDNNTDNDHHHSDHSNNDNDNDDNNDDCDDNNDNNNDNDHTDDYDRRDDTYGDAHDPHDDANTAEDNWAGDDTPADNGDFDTEVDTRSINIVYYVVVNNFTGRRSLVTYNYRFID